MGRSKQRRKQFLNKHPYCCFCGGIVASETEDHIPPRTIFDNRQWPEGFVFPACVNCNHASRSDEQICGLVCRFSSTPPDDHQLKEFSRHAEGVRNNFPGLVESMLVSANAKRTALSLLGLQKGNNETYNTIPLVKLGPEVKQALQTLGFKLGCALHYRHVGRAIPSPGIVVVRPMTNVQLLADGISPDFKKACPHLPELARAKSLLNDQFSYRIGSNKDAGISAALAVFRNVILLYIMTTEDPHQFGGFRDEECFEVQTYLKDRTAAGS